MTASAIGMSLLAGASAPPRVILDDEPRDRVPRRPDGQRVAREPARVLQLLAVDGDLAARVLRDEADHELAREGPVLAADVLDLLHVHADFFLHLAGDGALQRFAVVDEPGDERVAPGRPDGLAGQQHALAVANEHDDARVQMWVVLVAALRAASAPLALDAGRGLAAARTVTAGRLPPERLHGHAAEREQVVGELGALHRHTGLPAVARRQLLVAGKANHPARLAPPRAEQERPLGRHFEGRGRLAERQGQLVVVVGDDEALVLHDEPVATEGGQRPAQLGGFEGLADTVAVEGQGRGHWGHRANHMVESEVWTNLSPSAGCASWTPSAMGSPSSPGPRRSCGTPTPTTISVRPPTFSSSRVSTSRRPSPSSPPPTSRSATSSSSDRAIARWRSGTGTAPASKARSRATAPTPPIRSTSWIRSCATTRSIVRSSTTASARRPPTHASRGWWASCGRLAREATRRPPASRTRRRSSTSCGCASCPRSWRACAAPARSAPRLTPRRCASPTPGSWSTRSRPSSSTSSG